MTGKVWIVQSAPFFLLFQKYFVMLYLLVDSAPSKRHGHGLCFFAFPVGAFNIFSYIYKV